MARTGRRPAGSGAREKILAAARDAFAARGFGGVTMRQIASIAAVDPALVHHYFGTKDQLFLTVLRSAVDPDRILAQLLAGGVDTLGERIVAEFLRLWEGDAGANASALLRTAATADHIARLVREVIFPDVVDAVMSKCDLDPGEAPLRAAFVASQLAGLAFTRYLVELEPLAAAAADIVIRTVGATVQRYLTGELPSPNP
ncbi:TetR family transcriptional regulator [Micromonospora aurantiaca]|uniref:TetR/AcrR family transcriptional regulator n=1 Tax=Micromonospora aurantiaca (nom. illeg.) TaxID=47850 RepID=A0A1C6TMU9_9ACTN|nr:TetR family transcriptional regulator [Micromonospora aurantiaca]MCY9555653.1 TetR family transcriptional regulator [Paenibacillus apiarius]AXH93623.1 TetR/AcrR family transcriptional regulator [Micromonospora aurantiaca]KAB1117946.1 TetR/AcrR family transcriptional regulator [Micromonospora aurantiaca]UFN92605.1 TetR family transcriptional regulator [Micromonospora aurantiaca]SCL43086.1 transcriptional regulator, TetR family [Micromonospora aurantiaca]